MNFHKPIYVLGTGLSHDGSACLLKNGRVQFAIEKERLSRRKHDGFNDTAAVQYCLQAEGITLDDVALVVQNANFGMMQFGKRWWDGPRLLRDDTRVVTISHHLAHAYSAIGTSPFEECAVLVIDGCGNALDECIDLDGATVPSDLPSGELRTLFFEKDSYYTYAGGRLTPVYKDFSPWGMFNRGYPMHPNTTLHSVGGLYQAASTYAFRGFDDSGKLMGLAPYGRPGVHDFEIFDLRDGRVFVRYDWMKEFNRPARSFEEFKSNFQYFADIAWWIQREVERAILYVVRTRHAMTPSRNLAYSGGVALNAVANRRILTESSFEQLYVQPAAGDNGLAIGCAYYGWLEILGQPRIRHDGSPFLGKRYWNIGAALKTSSGAASLHITEPEDHIRCVAELLAAGKVVAWFEGGSEFGPRALGHRSILADPRNPEIRQFINAKIKLREDFRPFAPVVLAEDAQRYFESASDSPYMLLVAPVRAAWADKIPAVVHRDRSARLQTVRFEQAPSLYRLLQHFRELTGIGVLLNTSLNRRGMPIVETPEQALEFYMGCKLDTLAIEGYLVERAADVALAAWSASDLFNGRIGPALDRHADEARTMGGIYRINVTGEESWTLDLCADRPCVAQGFYPSMADVVLDMDEATLRLFYAAPETEGFRLFDEGKLKVAGNLELALNVAKVFEWTK